VITRLAFSGLTVAVVCCACANTHDGSLAALPFVPPPAQGTPYQVQVGDELAVRLYLTPELNEDVTVRPDGRITTQLAEAVPAAGLTPEQISLALLPAYGVELKSPRLTVEVKSYSPVRVYVAGEVSIPGELATAGPPPTLLQAIARAGGLRPTGNPDGVLVVRRGPDNHPVVYRTHYGDAFSGRDASADVTLQPFDVVVVPKTDVAAVYLWVNQHIQQFVPVSWGFSYNFTPLPK
jgi:polysaccharide export outer membrane protein